jgi:alkylation response protein AidB-like acyl-CoA dehydrogenase
MSELTTLALPEAPTEPNAAAVLDEVERIAHGALAAQILEIDRDGRYPEQVMRSLGAAGAFHCHLPGRCDDLGAGLKTAIEAMSSVGEYCTSTAFCMWCQDALAWYIHASDNHGLIETLGRGVAAGTMLGGTGLSNPVKARFGIEKIRLNGKRTAGGYNVRGVLPWVSNLGEDHCFAVIFEVDGGSPRTVMAIVDCSGPGVTIHGCDDFVAMNGTRTFAVQLRDAFIADDMVVADCAELFLPKIQAGFILLQLGMGFGLIRSCIDMMQQMRRPLGHINCYLDDQPEIFQEILADLKEQTYALAATPFESDPAYLRRVVEVRLLASDACVRAAHNAMLHCGARGYLSAAPAQRRLREAYFVAIVTPATKQLKKILADLAD